MYVLHTVTQHCVHPFLDMIVFTNKIEPQLCPLCHSTTVWNFFTCQSFFSFLKNQHTIVTQESHWRQKQCFCNNINISVHTLESDRIVFLVVVFLYICDFWYYHMLLLYLTTEMKKCPKKYKISDTIDMLKTHMIKNFIYLVNVDILSEKGALLGSRLPAVIGQDLSEG